MRRAMLERRMQSLQEEMLRTELELLLSIDPLDVGPEPVNDVDARAATRVLEQRGIPRRRARRRRPAPPENQADMDLARKALKSKGMLKP